jgi:hypothetical protein
MMVARRPLLLLDEHFSQVTDCVCVWGGGGWHTRMTDWLAGWLPEAAGYRT